MGPGPLPAIAVHLREILVDVELGTTGPVSWSPTAGTPIRRGSCQFGAPKQVWSKLHDQLAADDGGLRAALAEVRAAAGADDKVSILRTLDVVLWRRHVDGHWRDRPKDCPQRGSVAL